MVRRILKIFLWLFSGVGVVAITWIKWDTLNYDLILNYSLAFLLATICFALLHTFVQFGKRRNLHTYIKCKIKELISILSDRSPMQIPYEIKYNCSKLLRYHDDTVDVLRQVICKNQGLLADFVYNAGELHKPLKEELKVSTPNTDKLKECSSRLMKGINEHIFRAFEANNELALSYFKNRSEASVRFCIKVITEPNIIDDYYRPTAQCDYQSRTYQYKDNKGCLWVVTKGTYYLCNDIPLHIFKEDYFNPRIDDKQVRQRMRDGEKFEDLSKWCQCWYPNKGPNGEVINPEPESCYKSTLIVPMTLLRNEMSKEFKAHFKIPEQKNNNELSRAIYGFACFDHIQENFFDKQIDWKVGYIFSDMLSLYLIVGNLYTKYSESYTKAQNIVNGNS